MFFLLRTVDDGLATCRSFWPKLCWNQFDCVIRVYGKMEAKQDGPKAGVDYPRNWVQFLDWFHSEEACRQYLDNLRWTSGFICPKCGAAGNPCRSTRGRLMCLHCKAQTTVTAGTILKTASARRTRNRFADHIAKFYSKPLFWHRAYFVGSVGGATLETVRAHVDAQGTEEHARKSKTKTFRWPP